MVKYEDYGSKGSDDSDNSDFEATWNKYKSGVKGGVIGFAALITVLSSTYTVKNDSVGLVKTFGKYTSTSKPGLHFKMPFIQSVEKVANQAVFTESFGFRDLKPGVKSEYIGVEEIKAGKADNSSLSRILEDEGLSEDGNIADVASNILRSEYLKLSGDQNMADVEWIVQYRISDPVAYSFNIRDPRKTLRDVSESICSLVCGDASVDEILTVGRSEIEHKMKVGIQKKLNLYNSGIEVGLVQMQSTHPPEAVRPSFNDVNKALQDKDGQISKAREQYNTEVPKARGAAEATIKQAEGYKISRINNAKGDVARFQEIYSEYRKDPAIARIRMYLEAMPDVLSNAKHIYFLESKDGMLLKKLDLNNLDGGK